MKLFFEALAIGHLKNLAVHNVWLSKRQHNDLLLEISAWQFIVHTNADFKGVSKVSFIMYPVKF